jgi:hypothetical protein
MERENLLTSQYIMAKRLARFLVHPGSLSVYLPAGRSSCGYDKAGMLSFGEYPVL